jgi:hypothetical protein
MPGREVRVLFLGDVCGRFGRKALKRGLDRLKAEFQPHFIAVNGENAAGGFGLTPRIVDEILSYGVDCITTGDHFLDRKELAVRLDDEPRLLRPLNYPDGVPGRGFGVYKTRSEAVAVINLLGRVFIQPVDCPFRRVEAVLEEIKAQTRLILIDFHAEATSEKQALGWFLDGRVSAVLGTHTHVQTADERILPKGSGYITDLGMTGSFDSVIGVERQAAIERFLYQLPRRLKPASSKLGVQGAFLVLDPITGQASSILRVSIPINSRDV